MLLHPMSQTDVFIVDVFLCLPTFQLLCLLVLPNYKTQRPPGAEQSSEYFYYRQHNDPSVHSYAVCVCCVCLFLCIYASHFLIAIYENNAVDLTATLNKPLLKQNNLPIFDLDDNCILSCVM